VEIMSPHYRSLRDGNSAAIPDQYGRAESSLKSSESTRP
jgi:hypothetical protein